MDVEFFLEGTGCFVSHMMSEEDLLKSPIDGILPFLQSVSVTFSFPLRFFFFTGSPSDVLPSLAILDYADRLRNEENTGILRAYCHLRHSRFPQSRRNSVNAEALAHMSISVPVLLVSGLLSVILGWRHDIFKSLACPA